MEKIIRECKNSSGKKFGQVIFDDKELLIQHDKKPELKITDPQVIQEVLNKTSLGIKQL